MSGHWPPEWDDEEDFPAEAEQTDTATEAELAEVAAYLASLSAPVLPEAVEARIGAALAAEAAARAGTGSADSVAAGTVHADTVPADAGGGSRGAEPESAAGFRTLGSVPVRARVRRRPRSLPSRDLWRGGPRRVMTAGALVVCLLLAGLGYLASRGGSTMSGSASSAAAAPAASASSSSAAAGAAGSSAAGSGPRSAPAAPEPAVPAGPSEGPAVGQAGGSFTVITSGTEYRRATLADQARTAMAGYGAARPGSAGAYSPASDLSGCVLRLTGGVPPKLVDRAAYQGTPVYVIASSSRVWVVGLGCTAAKPQVIASVPLAG